MDGLSTGTRPPADRLGRQTDWAVTWFPAPQARVRLFCMPHAGAGASTYRDWARRLAPAVEVVAIRPPGRETRFRERPYTGMEELTRAMVPALEPFLDRPYAWFGHSMGALVAYEACLRLRAVGRPGPVRLLVSGNPAPDRQPRRPPVHDLAPHRVLERLQELAGTPPELLREPALLATLLPLLRADFSVVETYRWRSERPLECPISVFGGTEDDSAVEEDLAAWHGQTEVDCTMRIFPGGHFFLHDPSGPAVLDAIRADLLT